MCPALGVFSFALHNPTGEVSCQINSCTQSSALEAPAPESVPESLCRQQGPVFSCEVCAVQLQACMNKGSLPWGQDSWMTGSKVPRGAQHRQRETYPPQRALVPPQAFLPPSTSNLLFHITKTPVRPTWDQGLQKLCPVPDPWRYLFLAQVARRAFSLGSWILPSRRRVQGAPREQPEGTHGTYFILQCPFVCFLFPKIPCSLWEIPGGLGRHLPS